LSSFLGADFNSKGTIPIPQSGDAIVFGALHNCGAVRAQQAMSVASADTLRLQRPLADAAQLIVARGDKKDDGGIAA
jgi:hypothetical protein